MKPIDPVITFVDGVSTFTVNSRPEAVIAITNTGKLILRTVSEARSSLRGGGRSTAQAS